MEDLAPLLQLAGPGAAIFGIIAIIRLISSIHGDRVTTYREIAVTWKEDAATCKGKLDAQITVVEGMGTQLKEAHVADEARTVRLEARIDQIGNRLESRLDNFERAISARMEQARDR